MSGTKLEEIDAILRRIEHEYLIEESESKIYLRLDTEFSHDDGWRTFGETLHISDCYVRIVVRIDPDAPL